VTKRDKLQSLTYTGPSNFNRKYRDKRWTIWTYWFI